MTKTKKLIAILVVVAMLFTFVAAVAACVDPEPDPDPTPTPTPGTHTCKHVCSVCGKCEDQSCTDSVCADKCPGHATSKYGTEEVPLSVAQALALADEECKANNDYTAEEVYAIGKVKSVGTTGSYLQNVYITDLTDSNKEVLIYSLNIDAEVATPVQNDIISIHGWIKNYEGTIEFANNKFDDNDDGTATNHYVYAYKNTRGTSTITLVNEDNATVTGLPTSKTNGEEVTFTVVAPADRQISEVKVSTGGLEKQSDDSYKFTVAGNATVTVTTADASVHVPELFYTLDTVTGEPKGTNNNYASSCDITVGDITWNLEGNSTMNPWRLGGKNLTTATDRSLTSKTAIEAGICKIVITYGAWSNSGITVNTVTLKVFDTDPTADGGASAIFTKDITADSSANGTVTVLNESGHWTNCYYQLTFNVTIPGGSNVYVSVSSIAFYA